MQLNVYGLHHISRKRIVSTDDLITVNHCYHQPLSQIAGWDYLTANYNTPSIFVAYKLRIAIGKSRTLPRS